MAIIAMSAVVSPDPPVVVPVVEYPASKPPAPVTEDAPTAAPVPVSVGAVGVPVGAVGVPDPWGRDHRPRHVGAGLPRPVGTRGCVTGAAPFPPIRTCVRGSG